MTAAENVNEAMKAAPPLAITGMTLLGFPMSDWVFALTAIYTAFQIILLARKTWKSAMATAPAPVGCNGNCPMMRNGGRFEQGGDD